MALILRKHWRPVVGGRVVRYVPGDELSEGHPKRDWLVRHGIAVEAGDSAPHLGDPVEPDEAPEDAQEAAQDGPEADVQDADAPEAKRPPKVAKLEMWQSYAKTQGVNPKGLTKDEIIGRLS